MRDEPDLMTENQVRVLLDLPVIASIGNKKILNVIRETGDQVVLRPALLRTTIPKEDV